MNYQNLLLASGLALLLAACSTETTKKETNSVKNGTENASKSKTVDAVTIKQFDLKPGAAGFIEIGMTLDSLKNIIPAENLKEVAHEQEGIKNRAYEIRNAKAGNQLLMLAEESCENQKCKLFRLRILSPKFSTAEGLRIGSTFGELQKAYKFSYIGIGEADFVALSDAQRMAFTLDISGFPSKPLYKIKAEDIPAETPVTSILLF
jgi:hypothetical protein